MQIEFIRLIDRLLQNAPQTRKTLELKEEMVQNLMEKYSDLTLAGKTREEAFEIAAASIGDLSELVRTLRREAGLPDLAKEMPEDEYTVGEEEPLAPPPRQPVYNFSPEDARERAGRLTAAGVMFFVLSPVPFLFFSFRIASLLLLAMVACGIGLLVYGASFKSPAQETAQEKEEAERPRKAHGPHVPYARTEEDEAKAREKAREKNSVRGAFTSAFWLFVVALYIVLSFQTGMWHITWVIFLFAPALQNLALALTAPTRKKMLGYLSGTLWTATTGIYFIISFATGQWHITWIIFLIATAVNNMLHALLKTRK